MKRIALLMLVVGFGLGACEKHDFEETRKLHEHHDSHGDHDGHDHHDHGSHKDHEKH